MRLSKIMSQDVKTIFPDNSVQHAEDLMAYHNIHHLVVMQGTEIVGIVSKDALVLCFKDPNFKFQCVSDVMSEDVITAPGNMTVQDAANLMRGRSIGCLPIIDPQNRQLVGIVSVSDLLELLGKGSGLSAKDKGCHASVGITAYQRF